MSICLQNLGIFAEDTRDINNLKRFTVTTFSYWKKYSEKKFVNMPLVFHPYKLAILGSQTLFNVSYRLYKHFINTSSNHENEKYHQNNLLLKKSQPFYTSRNMISHINVTQFKIDIINCHFCHDKMDYPKCLQSWL